MSSWAIKSCLWDDILMQWIQLLCKNPDLHYSCCPLCLCMVTKQCFRPIHLYPFEATVSVSKCVASYGTFLCSIVAHDFVNATD